ncbi:NrfD/PsrC family molybdoenzyme membrane anchor subunit [Pyrodictium abyssi]|uniref:Polysulfide reductase NrfD n=1 Tax=Pyrodictium abyssi TaxID=54256 RepID=A0ABM8IWU0_9CREN|nr:polysulfide reductase NrfD [Pyrodictium abyssi]
MNIKLNLVVAIAMIVVGAILLIPALDRYCPSCVAERSIYPFTAMMTAYITYAGFAAGLVLVASLCKLMGWLDDKWASHTLWAALGLLVAAWITVLLDLGRPDHAVWLLLNWQPGSRVAWMPVFYTVLTLLLLVLLLGHIRGGNTRSNMVLLAAAVVAAALLELNLGSVFGFAVGVPAWHGLYPAFSFLVAGVAGGAAAAALLAPLGARLHGSGGTPPVRPLAGLAVGAALLYLVMEYWRLLQAGYDPGLRAFFKAAGTSLWLELGLVAAAVALLSFAYVKRSYHGLAVASVILLAGLVAAKHSFIIHGQEARLEPSLVAPVNPYEALYGDTAYHVSGTDAAAIAAAILLGLGVFALGELLLALEPGEKPARLLLFRSISGKS